MCKSLVILFALALATTISTTAFARGENGVHGGGGHGGGEGRVEHNGGGHGGHGGGEHGWRGEHGWHGGGGGRVGIYLGAPVGWSPWWGYGYGPWPYDGYYYDSPYYEPSPVVAERVAPPVYVQRPTPTSPLWYYCPKPAGYYPYIQNCAQQWVPVDPNSVVPPAR